MAFLPKSRFLGAPAVAGPETGPFPGQVCWLECGRAPLDGIIGEVERLAASLSGTIEILEHSESHAVAIAHLAPTALDPFKGGLALAGASFAAEPAVGGDAPVMLFVFSSPSRNTQQSEQEDVRS